MGARTWLCRHPVRGFLDTWLVPAISRKVPTARRSTPTGPVPGFVFSLLIGMRRHPLLTWRPSSGALDPSRGLRSLPLVLAYALTDYTSKSHDSYRLQFGIFFPFWVGSTASYTPIGKGAAYLQGRSAHLQGTGGGAIESPQAAGMDFRPEKRPAGFSRAGLRPDSPAALDFLSAHGLHLWTLHGVPTLEAALRNTDRPFYTTTIAEKPLPGIRCFGVR